MIARILPLFLFCAACTDPEAATTPGSATTPGGNPGDLDGSTGLFEVDLTVNWADGDTLTLTRANTEQESFTVGSVADSLLFSGTVMLGDDLFYAISSGVAGPADDGDTWTVPPDGEVDVDPYFSLQENPAIVRYFGAGGTITLLDCPTVSADFGDEDPPADSILLMDLSINLVDDAGEPAGTVDGQLRGPMQSVSDFNLFQHCP